MTLYNLSLRQIRSRFLQQSGYTFFSTISFTYPTKKQTYVVLVLQDLRHLAEVISGSSTGPSGLFISVQTTHTFLMNWKHQVQKQTYFAWTRRKNHLVKYSSNIKIWCVRASYWIIILPSSTCPRKKKQKNLVWRNQQRNSHTGYNSLVVVVVVKLAGHSFVVMVAVVRTTRTFMMVAVTQRTSTPPTGT